MQMKAKKFLKREYLYFMLPYILIMVLGTTGMINKYLMQIFMLAGINIIMTVSLNLVNGITGQFSIGHAGFMAIGAYVSAIITSECYRIIKAGAVVNEGIFLVALFAGGAVAALFGFLIAQPTLKVKGDYLAIVTLGFGEVIRAAIRVIDYVGGPRGMTGISKMTSFTWVYVFVLLAVFGVRNFVDSTYGRSCLAIRENEIAADAMGTNTLRYKTAAFTYASFLAGIAGGLFAHLLMYIQPDSFAYSKSTDFLVYLYVGGVGSISGSIVGALVLTVLPELLRFLADWRLVIYAGLLLYMIICRPNGLMGGKEFKFLHLRTSVPEQGEFIDKMKNKVRVLFQKGGKS